MRPKEVKVDIKLTANLGNYESAQLMYGEAVDIVPGDDPVAIRKALFMKLVEEARGDLNLVRMLWKVPVVPKPHDNPQPQEQPPQEPQQQQGNGFPIHDPNAPLTDRQSNNIYRLSDKGYEREIADYLENLGKKEISELNKGQASKLISHLTYLEAQK